MHFVVIIIKRTMQRRRCIMFVLKTGALWTNSKHFGPDLRTKKGVPLSLWFECLFLSHSGQICFEHTKRDSERRSSSPLDHAKKKKKTKIVKLMESESERILSQVGDENEPGNPWLALAVTLGNESVFDSFLEKGLDVDDTKVLFIVFFIYFIWKTPKINRKNTGRR